MIKENAIIRYENQIRYDEYKARHTALENIRRLIEMTLQVHHQPIITRERSVHDILRALYKRFAPTEEDRRSELQQQYDILR
ncbi:hypothetical protein BDY21DRAFT_353459 [Lineolata rhizophorae]|uniref:Uncharacterized protein n=1 Tax=Lineolata rhizophorae TaxID=578093 RepID=A0A6A6NR99_9PEZI|nr:hypothetical protein BDY21DRAFT_353459 [Lineolata rhizophorae]